MGIPGTVIFMDIHNVYVSVSVCWIICKKTLSKRTLVVDLPFFASHFSNYFTSVLAEGVINRGKEGGYKYIFTRVLVTLRSPRFVGGKWGNSETCGSPPKMYTKIS